MVLLKKEGGRKRWQDWHLFLDRNKYVRHYVAVGLCARVISRQIPWFPGAVRENWLERRYFWLLHYAPCPEKLWQLRPPATYKTALVFHSKRYKSLSNFGFPRHDNKPFPSQRNKTSPRRIQTECAEKRGQLRSWLFRICSPFADHLFSNLTGGRWIEATPNLRLASLSVPDGCHEVQPGAAGVPKSG